MNVPLIQLPKPSQNGYATLSLYVGTSTFDEPEKYAGINHLLEHVLACNDNIDKEVGKRGLEHNAETHGGFVRYWFSAPEKHFKYCLDFLKKISSKPTFGNVKREAKAVRQELLSLLQDAEYYSDLKAIEALFPNTGFYRGQDATIMLKTLDSLSPKVLKWYFNNYYKGKMFIVISGGPKIKGAKKLNQIPKGLISSVPTMITPQTRCFHIVRPEIAKSQCKMLFFNKNCETGTQIKEQLAIATRILSGGLDSLLYRVLREKLNLVYSVSCSAEIEPYGIFIEIEWSCDTKKVKKSIVSIFSVIKKFDTIHYDGHKALMSEQLIRNNLLTSQDIVDIYGNDLVTWGHYKEIKDTLKGVKKIKPQEVKDVVKKYMEPRNSLFVHMSASKTAPISNSVYVNLS